MKKAFIIITLLIISVFSCGSFFVYKAFLKSYKKDFKAFVQLNKDKINTSEISINESELYKNTANITWLDENKEIMHNGILYDVLSKLNSGQKIILTLISDETEHQMKKDFASGYNEKTATSSSGLLKILKQFLALKFLSADNLSELSHSITSDLNFNEILFQIPSVFLPTNIIPPIS